MKAQDFENSEAKKSWFFRETGFRRKRKTKELIKGSKQKEEREWKGVADLEMLLLLPFASFSLGKNRKEKKELWRRADIKYDHRCARVTLFHNFIILEGENNNYQELSIILFHKFGIVHVAATEGHPDSPMPIRNNWDQEIRDSSSCKLETKVERRAVIQTGE